MLPAHLQSDIKTLLETDKVFSKSGVILNDFSWRQRESVFLSLMRTIIGQQLSTKAAETIWNRVAQGVGDISPKGFAKIDDDMLRGFGLSRQKISYARGLCDAVQSETFFPETLHDKDDEAVIADIMALKGFGVWSAQMIFSAALLPNGMETRKKR